MEIYAMHERPHYPTPATSRCSWWGCYHHRLL